MVEGFVARFCGLNENGKIFARLLLTDKFRQPLWTQAGFQRVGFISEPPPLTGYRAE